MLTLSSLKNALLASAVCATLCFLAPPLPAAPPSYTFDMTPYETTAKECLKLVAAGDMKGALKKAQEMEGKWDGGTTALQKADSALWGEIDEQMDATIAALRKTDAKKATAELNSYLELVARVPKPEKKK
jgi:hypothetical protein